jgi:hypothetical protein
LVAKRLLVKTQQPKWAAAALPSAALPSHSMVRLVAPTTHGTTASHGLMIGARGLVWWHHSWLACLGGTVGVYIVQTI